MKRTLYIGKPAYLSTKDKQMQIKKEGAKKTLQFPVEDLGLVVLDNPQITLTNSLISLLLRNNIAIINCNDFHMPQGLMLPYYGHSEYSEHIKHQLALSEPLRKQLWKQTVECKIRNQQALLKKREEDFQRMDNYWKNVQSGDISNMEGVAAQHYWKNIFPNFNRERYGGPPNNMLNYGYAVLRAIVARALVATGLLPVLGIFHHNKYNPFCLADDIMEPYRPFVDQMVAEYLEEYKAPEELTPDIKKFMLRIATEDVYIDGKERPLMVAVTTTVVSLYKCYKGEIRLIKYPKIITYESATL